MKLENERKEIISFTRKCLRDADYSKELIAYLFSIYDLETFIGESKSSKLEIACSFLAHARKIEEAGRSF